MKRLLALVLGMLVVVAACGEKEPAKIPSPDDIFGPGSTEKDPPTPSDFDYPERTAIPVMSDMVLLYGGSNHRSPVNWSQSNIEPYIKYTDKNSKSHWLFDSFLCLEFVMKGNTISGQDKTLAWGYEDSNGNTLPSAAKEDWEVLINYYFKSGSGIDAIEGAIASAAKTMGNPPTKRKIVIGMPEPIRYLYAKRYSTSGTGGTDYWGCVEEGKYLDFSRTTDRVKASKWFVDTVREKFMAKNYKYVELAGFYWVAEKATNTSDMMASLAEYITSLNYSFSWIPYYTAAGYESWAQFGFTQAYLQPNYFFDDNIDIDRLYSATKMANDAKMGLEIEFDGNASKTIGNKKLRDYMSIAKSDGFWENTGIAYYQGSWALSWLKNSSSAEDRALYEDFCEWVISRPFREKAAEMSK